MSSAPTRHEQSPATQAPHLLEVAEKSEQRRPFSVVSAATGAAGTVAVRTLGFGVLGFVLGAVAFFIERATGLLAHPAPAWGYAVWGLLPAYMVVGAFTLGTAGMWRGIGRSAMNLVKEHRFVQHIIGKVMDRVASLAASVPTPDILHQPLPIEALRGMLQKSIRAYAGSDDTEKGVKGLSRAILRKLKSAVCRHVEGRMNDLLGEQARDQGVVELTLSRLREVADEKLEARVLDALDGARNKQALLFSGIFIGVVVLPPMFLHLVR